ncbi:hypothetical protein ONA70_22825 [Micromonospora yasonensis]|uniref:hypothetical protein n=1 Tax=Micromonospora yasonensis TaxID=1128667 RepID=UPI00222FC160|nr:hypothetical protein [Micromonospora yasonensis]MCW3842937.1 hypothetical protein [Micromonospora yasonensis]
MTTISKWRLVEPVPGSRRRNRRPPKPQPKRRLGFLAGLATGMTIAVAISGLAFLTTRPEGRAAAVPPTHPASAHPTGSTAAVLDVKARHVGGLQVQIEVQAVSPGTYQPITMARMVAWTDMIAMPMSHRQGPIILMEVPGKRGSYSALANVPMIGEYDVRVELQQPLPAEAHERVDVQTVGRTS